MGTVFKVLALHDLPAEGFQLPGVGDPAGLDGCFAGYGVQQVIADRIPMLPPSVQKIGGQEIQGFCCLVRVQIHGDLPEQDGIFSEFLNFKAQLLQHFLVIQQFSAFRRAQTDGNGGEKGLTGNGLLVGLQIFKVDPLVGSVLIDEEGAISHGSKPSNITLLFGVNE